MTNPKVTVRLWLDDLRKPPKGWKWVKNFDQAVKWLATNRVEQISFDHDLGAGKSGYDVACWIEAGASRDWIGAVRWSVHSANTVGRERIKAAMRSAERFWNK
jgi:hypothetical protein